MFETATQTTIPPSTKIAPIRLVVQEPALAKYRVPIYRELASRPGIALKLIYGKLPNLPNVEPNGFDGEPAPLTIRHIGSHPVYWHQAQWDYAHSRNTDVLILQWDVHFASLIPALLRARFHGVPTILWGHGYSKQESSWRSALRNRIAKMATALLFYNFGAAQRFINDGWKPERIFVAINSLDQTPINVARETWLQQPDRLAAFRQEQRLSDGPIMLYVSRLDPDNRVDLGIRALHRMQESFPSLLLVVIGKGDSERSRLEQLAHELGIDQRVRFVDAIYDENELAPWFLSADVFCYPANIGLSLLHAFGYGLPVVTSDRVEAQNPEIEALRDGENGLLYTDGSVESLADALTKILADEALARHMSQVARQTVAEDFSLQRMVDGIVEAIEYCSKTRSKH